MMKCLFSRCVVLTLGATTALLGQVRIEADEADDLRNEMRELREQMQALREGYEERLSRLEQELEMVKSAASSKSTQLPSASTTPQQTSAPTSTTFSGGARTLQALNPEISATGDVTARYSDNNLDPDFNRFNFDSFEMALQHPLDPYSQAKFFLAFEDGEFTLEEGYMSWESLPGQIGLKVGRFHTNFGKMNRYHKHALPWADRDLPTRVLFGDEGLISTGLSLTWLPPRLPIAQTNEVYFEIFNNSNDRAFSGRGFKDPVFLGRLLNYYDLSDSAYFEWGVSAATSHWDLEKRNRSTVWGLDLGYRWQPPRRALYRSFELRSELFYNDRRNWSGGNPFGLFASGQYQLNRRWFAGLRYQFAQDLEDSREHASSLSPFLTFWQSEFVRLRAQYDHYWRTLGRDENRFFVQFTWSMGPHKHEAY